jgi:hypothetical protein
MGSKVLHYQEMPNAIKNLVDGSEFLQYVKRICMNGIVSYQLVFRDSYEMWARWYNAKGEKLKETPFVPVEA